MTRSPLRWWVCGLLLLATTLNYMDRVALNQTAKRIQITLGFNNAKYAELESGFFVAFALGTLFFGWLVDRVSVRWVYPAVVLGWSAAGFATGFAESFVGMMACRVVLGLFEAGNWPCGIRTTRQLLSPEERPLGNSLFQGGTALGAVITPQIVNYYLAGVPLDHPTAWREVFRVIGVVGGGWVLLWVLTAPGRLFARVEPKNDVPTPFAAVFRDRRFWILIAVIVGVNVAWHTARVWLPKYLQETRGYSETQMGNFTSLYYLTADVGSWTVGLTTLILARTGWTVHRARVLTFAGCCGLVLSSLALPFLEDGWLIAGVLLLYGFGALGLFPNYFAFSQDVSAAHQGKVTGTLGCINAFILAGVVWLEGQYIEATQRYEVMLAAAGLPAAAALVLIRLTWPKEKIPTAA